jgi:hypothetical protein
MIGQSDSSLDLAWNADLRLDIRNKITVGRTAVNSVIAVKNPASAVGGSSFRVSAQIQ